MELSAQITASTGEATASGLQTINALNDAIGALAAKRPALSKFARLSIGLQLYHPVALPRGPTSARFHPPTNTVYAAATIDYMAWTEEQWDRRVEAVVDALNTAVGKVAKSRLTKEERATILDIIRQGAEQTKATRPSRLASLKPVYLVFVGASDTPSVSFAPPASPPPSGLARVEVLPPSALAAYLARLIHADDSLRFVPTR